MIPLASYLLTLAVVIFLLEIVHRRTGISSFRRKTPVLSPRKVAAQVAETAGPAVKHKTKRSPVAAAEDEKPQPAASPPPAEEKPAKDGMSDALSQAQRRARKRTERG